MISFSHEFSANWHRFIKKLLSQQVLNVLGALRSYASRAIGRPTSQHISNALYGLQGMSSKHQEVREILVVIADLVGSCEDRMSAREVGSMLYGLQVPNLKHM